MIDIIEKKIQTIRREAERQMMERSVAGDEASGRFAACCTLLDGVTPEDALDALSIFPPSWPQRRGAKEIYEQFKGLI